MTGEMSIRRSDQRGRADHGWLDTRHDVLVDDPQRAEAHVRRVVVVREAERVVAVEPTVVGVAARFCRMDDVLHAVGVVDHLHNRPRAAVFGQEKREPHGSLFQSDGNRHRYLKSSPGLMF